jgi:hypothetical protein
MNGKDQRSFDWEGALKMALEELTDLMAEREDIDTKREQLDSRIFRVREGLVGLALLSGTDSSELAKKHPHLFPDLISPDVGLTDAVRQALESKRIYMSPVEVRNRLVDMKYDMKRYTNVLASIHTILKRLVDSGEVDAGNREGKVVYRWSDKAVRDAMERGASGIYRQRTVLSSTGMRMGPPPEEGKK